MAKHTISFPVKVIQFFEDLDDAERGVAYSLLIKYIQTGQVPDVSGRPSAVKLAIRYAVEKMQRSVQRRFAAARATVPDQPADAGKQSGQDIKAVQETSQVTPPPDKIPDNPGPVIFNDPSIPRAHIDCMEEIVRRVRRTCPAPDAQMRKIIEQLHCIFPGLYSHITVTGEGKVKLCRARKSSLARSPISL